MTIKERIDYKGINYRARLRRKKRNAPNTMTTNLPVGTLVSQYYCSLMLNRIEPLGQSHSFLAFYPHKTGAHLSAPITAQSHRSAPITVGISSWT